VSSQPSYFITTAIDYTNGKPHIGHAYEKVLSDVLARYHRLKGEKVYFLTGVDQHGQKVQQTAEKEGVNPRTYVKKLTKSFVNLWDKLGLSHDAFAETTNPLHIQCVQKILSDLKEQGALYKKAYKGFYSVRQEQFLTDKERGEDGEFGPEWGEVVELEEENWYFKLSEHADWLRDFVSKGDFVFPEFRKTEVLNAIDKAADTDLCISRPKSRLHWGIELPFDTDYVTYVWFDALINYISFAGYEKAEGSDLPEFTEWWPAAAHVIGKDILVPSHSIYWPAMLHAMGFTDEQMPKLLVHGWWNFKGKDGKSEKMSKSLGNVVDPNELVDKFGVEATRYYLVRDIVTGRDSDFDWERFVDLYNKELPKTLGNLLNRSLGMMKKNFGEGVPELSFDDEDSSALREAATTLITSYQASMDENDVPAALAAIYSFLSQCNAYADRKEPWSLAKDETKKAELATVLYHLVEPVALASVLLSPIIPTACARIQGQLKAEFLEDLKISELKWGLLPTGHVTGKAKPVFPQISLEEKEA